MPVKRVRLRHPPCPWLTDNSQLRALMRDRDLARADCDADPSPETRQVYRAKRNAVKGAECRARTSFFLSSYKFSRKTTWKDIRRFLVSPKRAVNEPSESKPEWAEKLNQHFASVGARVAAELAARSENVQTIFPCPPRVVSGAFRVHPVTLPELSNCLKSMSSSKASGEDGITVAMLRMTFSVVGPHLLNIINSSLTSGVIPVCWKTATVMPIFKSGCREDPSNYRPISILPTVAKLAERVVCTQLLEYLISYDVLCDEQHGFRPGRSTESAMLDAVSYLTTGMDQGMVSCLTTADTSKAFDSVQHRRLLDKLGWYGIDCHWFENWLSDRCQRVRGRSGAAVAVDHGVIQGSILGPILFLLFTNDLTSSLSGGKVVLYADDAQFIHGSDPKDMEGLQNSVQTTLSRAKDWFVQNGLKINPQKSEILLVASSRRRINVDFEITFDGATLHPAHKVTVLGVVLDKSLTFEDHISVVIRRCYATLGGLSKMSRRLPEEVKKLLIESLVFPHILYCATVWAGCNLTQRKRLQKVINHSVRIVKNLRRSTI